METLLKDMIDPAVRKVREMMLEMRHDAGITGRRRMRRELEEMRAEDKPKAKYDQLI